jgi:hypothetical protein
MWCKARPGRCGRAQDRQDTALLKPPVPGPTLTHGATNTTNTTGIMSSAITFLPARDDQPSRFPLSRIQELRAHQDRLMDVAKELGIDPTDWRWLALEGTRGCGSGGGACTLSWCGTGSRPDVNRWWTKTQARRCRCEGHIDAELRLETCTPDELEELAKYCRRYLRRHLTWVHRVAVACSSGYLTAAGAGAFPRARNRWSARRRSTIDRLRSWHIGSLYARLEAAFAEPRSS